MVANCNGLMKATSVKIKAAFLLVGFVLNTAVGFACSIGVDMGYNQHHHNAAHLAAKVHNASKQHGHHKKAQSQHPMHKAAGDAQQPDGEDCCSHGVLQFAKLDKSVTEFFKLVPAKGSADFLPSFFYSQTLPVTRVVQDVKPFVRSYHPPIPQIYLAVQSFLI